MKMRTGPGRPFAAVSVALLGRSIISGYGGKSVPTGYGAEWNLAYANNDP